MNSKKRPPKKVSDAKPRSGGPRGPYSTEKSAVKWAKGSARLMTNGGFATVDRSPSGGVSGVVFGVIGPSGGISGDPAHAIAYRIRQAFKPRVIAPVTITGPDGRVVRTVTFGPNGERLVTPSSA
jgi:hypothetical protein